MDHDSVLAESAETAGRNDRSPMKWILGAPNTPAVSITVLEFAQGPRARLARVGDIERDHKFVRVIPLR
jgi:hypothetical protein